MLSVALLHISRVIVKQMNGFVIMDSNKIQWILQHGSNNFKLQLEELMAQVNLVVGSAIAVSITIFTEIVSVQ